MSGNFSVTLYGQNPIVMDWNGLADPFQQFFPVNITNNWSGGLYFVGSLINPPVWYSGTAYSGIAFSGGLAGAVPLGSINNDTYNMTWTINVSGNSIQTSSPNTDSLTLLITAYASGFFSGIIASAVVTFSNTLYDRNSGVIKMIGELYNNDVPVPAFTQLTGGTFAANQQMAYAISYIESGWESDIGSVRIATIISGTVQLTWPAASEVIQNYLVWRWSGANDLPSKSSLSGLNPAFIDLVYCSSATSFTDTNVAPLQAGMARYRAWKNVQVAASTHNISPPYSISTEGAGGNPSSAKLLFLNRNISGTNLIGPWYLIFHLLDTAGGNSFKTPQGIQLQTGNDSAIQGQIIVPVNLGYTRLSGALWRRFGFYISGAHINSSGYIWFQYTGGGGGAGVTQYIDDTFIVANS